MMLLSVVVPVYNSTSSLKQLTRELIDQATQSDFRLEIVFVDDGSAPPTWDVLTELKNSHPTQIKIIRLMRNFGQHNAILCGFRHATGSYVVTMDDDLQNPPSEIPKLISAINDKHLDLVYGRAHQKMHSVLRNIFSYLAVSIYKKSLGVNVTPTSYRIISRPLIDSILSHQQNFVYLDGLLAWHTNRIGSVFVAHAARQEGKSGYSLRKLVRLAMHLIINFTTLPLRAVCLIGLISAFLGFAFGAYTIINYFILAEPVPGYTSLVCLLTFFGGLQMLAFGIIGEYFTRIIFSVNAKPQYVVRNYIE